MYIEKTIKLGYTKYTDLALSLIHILTLEH